MYLSFGAFQSFQKMRCYRKHKTKNYMYLITNLYLASNIYKYKWAVSAMHRKFSLQNVFLNIIPTKITQQKLQSQYQDKYKSPLKHINQL